MAAYTRIYRQEDYNQCSQVQNKPRNQVPVPQEIKSQPTTLLLTSGRRTSV